MTKYISNLERNARSKERWAGFASGNIDSLGSTKHTVSLGLSQQCIVRKVAFSNLYLAYSAVKYFYSRYHILLLTSFHETVGMNLQHKINLSIIQY